MILPIFRTIGGGLDSSSTHNTHRVGEATWIFVACNQSQLIYHLDDSEVADASAARIRRA